MPWTLWTNSQKIGIGLSSRVKNHPVLPIIQIKGQVSWEFLILERNNSSLFDASTVASYSTVVTERKLNSLLFKILWNNAFEIFHQVMDKIFKESQGFFDLIIGPVTIYFFSILT